jgi:hypothetical protein
MAQSWESIASDCSGDLLFGLLPADTVSRIAGKFSSFRDDRIKIHRRMESYVRDYESHKGSATRRYESLEEEYSEDAPDLSHLVPRGDGSASSALWSMKDMAIILGRNISSVLRTVRKMKAHPEWGKTLASHEFRREKSGREAVTMYDAGVFDAIVDYFESVYLERFTSPRRGEPMDEGKKRAVYSLWEYMKANPDNAEKLSATCFAEGVRAYGHDTEAALADLYRNVRAIVKRAFSIKPGTFFLLFFALVYELSKKYPFLNAAVPIASIIVLGCTLVAMNRRKHSLLWLHDIGACSITLLLLWSLAAVASPDGPAAKLLPNFTAENKVLPQQPIDGGDYANTLEEINEEISPPIGNHERDYNPPERPDVKVDYSRSHAGGGKFDVWIHTRAQAKEILYKTPSGGDFKSTGFSDGKRADGTLSPLRALTLDTESSAGLLIKYIDISDKTHGPYKIDFNYRSERMKEVRRILDEDIKWVDFSDGLNGTSVSTNVVSELEFRLNAPDIVERVMYGVNRRTPYMERVFTPGGETGDDVPGTLKRKLESSLITDSREKIWFVSIKIIFRDGNESNVRIFDNPYAEPD